MIALRKRPVLCNYYITYRCNASCNFCDIWEKPSPYVTIETFTQNLKALKQLGVKIIDFTGGEPLLNRNLPEMLRLSKAAGMITTVTTNTLLYPKYAKNLTGLIDMLHFSLDSVEEHLHNTSRNVNCFNHVKESIMIAASLGERPDILFTVGDHNVDELEELYTTWARPNNVMIIINPLFGYNDVGTNILSEKSMQKLERFAKQPLVYLNQGFLKLRRAGGNSITKPVCKAASTTIVITPENELLLPCYHAGVTPFRIADNLDTLYHSPEVQRLIASQGRMPACEGCVVNCYMQPSFTSYISPYFFAALPSTLKYIWTKQSWQGLAGRN